MPASACSNPASTRSRVVLPLPDGPRIAVSEPAGTSMFEAGEHLVSTEPLVQPGDRQLGHVIILGSAAPRSKNRPSTQLGMAATAIITSANGAACP